jgi:hypothetical protein
MYYWEWVAANRKGKEDGLQQGKVEKEKWKP